jgi:ribosomal protein S18 acetylase RimI-like enzyme
MEVFQARLEHLEAVAKLFDQYRVFYQQPSNLEAAKGFLQERLQKNDSAILVASHNESLVGFTQLYPSFSSVMMQRVWILNDLFVEEAYRKQGVARLLMDAAENFARATHAVRINLETQMTNTAAQALYESRGYCRDDEFYLYTLEL